MSSPTYREALDRLVRCAVVNQGAESLADLAGLSFESLLRQSGLEAEAGEIKLTPAPGPTAPPRRVGALFAAALNALDDRRRLVAIERTYARDPEKLEVLGAQFGVSRERARQLEVGLRHMLQEEVGHAMASAAGWLRSCVGSATDAEEFDEALEALVGDAPEEVRSAAEVALMQVADYQRLESGVGDAEFRELVARVQMMTARYANAAGVVDEEQLMDAVGGRVRRWDLAVRNAGLVRIGEYLTVRDTRRARVFVALERLGEPVTRPRLAEIAGLADNTTLSSLLSSDRMFVRLTKDKWGLKEWTDNPYEGVVAEIVKRIKRAGGEIAVDELVEEIPMRFDVLPATVRNYLSTRKFETRGGMVRVVGSPEAPSQPLSEARDVVWTPDGDPAIHLVVGAHHLKGNSQKVSIAVAQRFGVGPDGSAKVPFADPAGVDDASMIWRSYDPNGPEMGRLREAMEAVGAEPGDLVTVILRTDGLRMVKGDAGAGAGDDL